MGKKYAIDERTLGSIADAIRQHGGDFVGKDKMTTLEMARDKIPLVYHKGCSDGISQGIDIGKEQGIAEGRQAEYDRFWDMYQDNGKRRNYNVGYGGTGWTDETYNPKYDMICNGSAQTMYGNSRITTTKRLIDWSAVTNTSYAFSNCPLMIEIVMLVVSETTPFHSTTFSGLTNLVDMRMGGTVGDGLDISNSTKLNKASHLSIFGCISTTAAITVTVSRTAVNKAFETATGANDGSTSQEWNDLVATRPNATIVLA